MLRPQLLVLTALTLLLSVGATGAKPMSAERAPTTATAVLGGGCFWCIEAVYEEVAGVLDAESGYAGGHTADPDYRSVTGGKTGHAEVVKVTYDPAVISYEEILLIFFSVHDPTTRNRQGADVGPQYRSIILPADPGQQEIAERVIGDLERDQVFERPIVTEVQVVTEDQALAAYHRAEDYHQDYFRRNPTQGYCQVVIAPKLAKFRQTYQDRLRKD